MCFNDMIQKFAKEHPIWAWILARLAICTCTGVIVVLCLLGMVAIIAPLASLAGGAGLGVLWVWLLIPVIATMVWGLASVITYLVVEVCDD